MNRKNAVWLRTWHRRFWIGVAAGEKDTAKWHDQITSLNVSWHRVVVINWRGVAVHNLAHVKPILTWVRKNMAGTCMILPRGVSHAHHGVQIWTTNSEDVTMLALSSIGATHRCFDPSSFAQHMSDALKWIHTPQ